MEKATQTAEGEPKAPHKPSRSPEELIAKLKADGVTYAHVSEEDAADFLRYANNYLRTASYRKLYPRQVEGEHKGEYVNLDFAYLMDLSAIDRRFRATFRAISDDIEHFAGMKLKRRSEEEGEDGYAVIRDYLDGLGSEKRRRLLGSLRRRATEGDLRDTYTGDLIAHYADDYPLWAFTEVIEFGRLNDLYLFCARRWDDRGMEKEHYVLKSVKALRNASSHGNCVVNGFSRDFANSAYTPRGIIADALKGAGLTNSKNRRAKMKNLRIAQIASTLWALDRFCTRDSTKRRDAKLLAQLKADVEARSRCYEKNEALASYLDFVWRLVDIWVPNPS